MGILHQHGRFELFTSYVEEEQTCHDITIVGGGGFGLHVNPGIGLKSAVSLGAIKYSNTMAPDICFRSEEVQDIKRNLTMNWPDHIGEHVMPFGSNGPSYRRRLK